MEGLEKDMERKESEMEIQENNVSKGETIDISENKQTVPPVGYVNGQPVMSQPMMQQPMMPQPMMPQPGMPQPMYYRKTEAPMLVALKENFSFYGIATLLYAFLFTFCLYKNAAGITAPFFTAGTLCYCFLCLKKLGVPIKKDAIFYAVSIMLLGVNLCMTLDTALIIFDYIGIILVGISGMLHLFYDDKEWGLGKYMTSFGFILTDTIGKLFRVFGDWSYYKKKSNNKDSKVKFIVIGFFAALPILFIVIVLLASADSVFGKLIGDQFLELEGFSDIFQILITFAAAYLITYGVLAAFASYEIPRGKKKVKLYEPLIAITINVMLAVVYLLFSVIQILYLFIGNLQLPDNMTYAEYAKQGFFQLLAVCVINLILVLISLYYFRSSKVLKGVLTVITGCTYIMIASSFLRMYMYVEAYNLTYLRVLTFWMLIVLTLLMTGILIYSYLPKFPLFRYSVVIVTICYLILAFARPDYLIAKYNLRENQSVSRIDTFYLRNNCSPDTAPAVMECINAGRYPEIFFEEEFEYLNRMEANYEYDGSSIRAYNFSGEEYLKLQQYFDSVK